MLEFSNAKEAQGLKVAVYLTGGAVVLPVVSLFAGEVDMLNAGKGVVFFLSIFLIAFLGYRFRVIEVRLFDTHVEIDYPVRKLQRKINLEDILSAEYSDITSGLSLLLKDGKRLSLGSTISKMHGSFTNPNFSRALPGGDAGDRHRLQDEINLRVSIQKK